MEYHHFGKKAFGKISAPRARDGTSEHRIQREREREREREIERESERKRDRETERKREGRGNLSKGLLTKVIIFHVAPFPKRGLYSKFFKIRAFQHIHNM